MSQALPPFELGVPGSMRDRLVGAVLSGQKTATTSLRVFYDLDEEPLPRPGERARLVDSSGDTVGIVRTTQVAVVPLAGVGEAVAHAEGEGFADVLAWRTAHLEFWERYLGDIRTFLEVDSWTIDDDTRVVVEHFVLEH